MKQASIKAYAKINLVLDVLRKREDGYHEVEMVMQAISLYDEIKIKPAQGIAITTDHPLVPKDERNLAYQAVRLIQKKCPSIPGVEISIKKQIPVEAGLAGGSTDGAAVILGMNKLFSLGMTQSDMLDIAEQLGSDVPFCILGPTALAKGRGEIITPIADCPLLWIVLVKPLFGVKTPEVYKNLDLKSIARHPAVSRYREALENKDVEHILSNMVNVLEYSSFKLYPQVKDLKEYVYNLGATNVLMSGSGPTVFAIFDNEKEAQLLARKVKNKYSEVYIAHTVSKREIEERVNLS